MKETAIQSVSGLKGKRFVFGVLLALCCYGDEIAAQKVPIQPGDTVIVTTRNAQLSLGTDLLIKIPRGKQLTVVSIQGDWISTYVRELGRRFRGSVPVRHVLLVPPSRLRESLKTRPEPARGEGDSEGLEKDALWQPRASLAEAGHSARFSPDGKTLVTWNSNNNVVTLWDVAAGKERTHFIHDRVRSVRFLGDGMTLATISRGLGLGGAGMLKQWNARSGGEIHGLRHIGPGYAPMFSSDGKKLAAFTTRASSFGMPFDERTHFDKLRFWDVTTGEQQPASEMIGAVFSRVSVIGEITGCVEFWGLSPDGITLAPMSPDGKTMTLVHQNGTITLWNVAMPSERASVHHPGNERPFVTLFTQDSKTLLTVGERFVKVWDVATGKERASFEDARVLPKLSPDGKTIVLGGTSELKLIDLRNGQERATLTNTSMFQFSPDGKSFATGTLGARNHVTLRQTATGKAIATLAHDDLLDIRFSPNGKTLATIGEDMTVKLWDGYVDPANNRNRAQTGN